MSLSCADGDARIGALAILLEAPMRPALTDAEVAASLRMMRDLTAHAAGAMAAAMDGDTSPPVDAIWNVLLQGGFGAAGALAPALLARMEEHRWRQASARITIAPSAPRDRLLAVIDRDAEAGDEPAQKIDDSYLALRIADGARHDAGQGPCVPIAELPVPARAMLFDDVAAAWTAVLDGAGDDSGDASRLIETAAALRSRAMSADIDSAADAYVAALDAAECTVDAFGSAVARHDWCAAIAILSVRGKLSYGDCARALLIGSTSTADDLCRRARLPDADLEALLGSRPARAAIDAGVAYRRQLMARAAILRLSREN